MAISDFTLHVTAGKRIAIVGAIPVYQSQDNGAGVAESSSAILRHGLVLALGVGLVLAVGVLATTAQLLMTRAWAIGHPLVNAALQYLGIAFSVGLGPATTADITSNTLVLCGLRKSFALASGVVIDAVNIANIRVRALCCGGLTRA
jgi:Na+-driven multidrug efflux pump